MKKIHILCIAASLFLVCSASSVQAQLIPGSYFNVDWQVNVPMGSSFADKTTGWGMNIEGGGFVTPEVSIGAFMSYHTNLQSLDRQTLHLSPGTALTAKQEHALFQLPFGVSTRYNFMKGSVLQPYVGLKLGASFARMSSYYYVVKQSIDTWGFYMAPEVGVSIFPAPAYRFGFHVALFYGYATNSGSLLTYSIDNINSFGVRVGISF